MPSFDVVSAVDAHELANAVDQAKREIATRFDFKGVPASFELKDSVILLTAESDFQLKQMLDILGLKLTKRDIDVACLDVAEPVIALNKATQAVTVRQGVDAPLAKKIVKQVKESKMKIQAAIQGDQVRITGKKRDDLQAAMALIRAAEYDLPLQFENFRD